MPLDFLQQKRRFSLISFKCRFQVSVNVYMRDQISMLGMPSLNLTAAPLSSCPPPSLVAPAFPGPALSLLCCSYRLRSPCLSLRGVALGDTDDCSLSPAASISPPLIRRYLFCSRKLLFLSPLCFFPIRRRVSLISLCSTGVSRYLAYPLGSPPRADRYYSSSRSHIFRIIPYSCVSYMCT